MGPIFYNFLFSKISKIFECSHGEHQKIVKTGPTFQEKSLKMSTFFCQKSPLNMSKGFKAWAADSRPNQIWVTPRALNPPKEA